jgi:hypothetical protein
MLKNPFCVYIATFGGGLAIYQLGWSGIMPALSYELIAFFVVTGVAATILARYIAPSVDDATQYTPGLLPRYSIVFIVVTFLIEVMLNGIPLWRVMRGENFYAIEAVSTHLHVFVLWSIFSVIRFADFAYSRRLSYLLEAVLPIIFYALFVYRGPALILATSWVFIFITRQANLRLKHLAIGIAAVLLVFYANGKIGDARSPGHESQIGAPTEAFKSSGVPATFFWTYLYVTVPIGNLQLNVDTIKHRQGTVPEFIVTEFIPDTFSKRIMPFLNSKVTTGSDSLASRDLLYGWAQPMVGHGMNISTIFGRSYGYLGWLGPIIMFVTLSIVIVIYLHIIKGSPYRVPALALLNTLVVFCLFNNMIASAAMAPLLVIILLLPPWAWIRLNDLKKLGRAETKSRQTPRSPWRFWDG